MMTDTDFNDLELIERRAYQDGNAVLARIAGIALTAQDENAEYAKELENTLDSRDTFKMALENIAELITEANWRTGKKAELIKLIASIVDESSAALDPL